MSKEEEPRIIAGRTNPRSLGARCPHCREIARSKGKKIVTPIYDEHYFQCPNLHCGHTWKAALHFILGVGHAETSGTIVTPR